MVGLAVPGVLLAAQPATQSAKAVHWDAAAYILATMAAPCEGPDCSAAANAIAVQVAERVATRLEPEDIGFFRNLSDLRAPPEAATWEWNSEAPASSVSDVLDQVMPPPESPVERYKAYQDGSSFLNGVADSPCGPVSWFVGFRRAGANEFVVSVEISGDCHCTDVFGSRISGFTVYKYRTFRIDEPGEDHINPLVYAMPTEDMKCTAFAQCTCAAGPEDDDAPARDADPASLSQMTLNPGKKLARSRETVCLAGQPCTRPAMPMLREIVEQIIAEHDTDLNLTFSVTPKEAWDTALMRQIGSIFDGTRSGSPFWDWDYHYAPYWTRTGSIASTCGTTPFEYELTLMLYLAPDDTLAGHSRLMLTTKLTLFGRCNCDPTETGDQLQNVQYTFALTEAVHFEEDTHTVRFEEEDRRCDVRANCYCLAERDEDPVPLASEGWLVSYDSAEHCTYGGGSTTFWLPGAPVGGLLATPVSLPVSPGFPAPPGIPGGSSTVPGGSSMGIPTPGAAQSTDEPPTQSQKVEQQPTISTTTATHEDDDADEEPPAEPQPPDETDETDETDEPAPEQPPPGPVLITVKATNAALEAGASVTGAQGMVTFAPEPGGVPGEPLAEHDTESGAGEPENSHLIEAGETQIPVSAALAEMLGNATIDVDITPSTGNVLRFEGEVAADDVLPETLLGYVQATFAIDGYTYIATSVPSHLVPGIQDALDSTGAVSVEVNLCVDPRPLADPLFSTEGTWSQPYPDQWGIRRVGFTDDDDSAWAQLRSTKDPVVIAVVDSGLDWNHLEIARSSLWRNPGEIPANGLDDDGNGYVDDLIGWDFWDNDRKPWDIDGHGTFVAGIMFAEANNGTGIKGISRNARLMVLKAMNAFGHSRASNIAQAILYAVDNGARVINLSLGGPGTSTVVREAIRYAYEHDVVVVIAAGNEAVPAEDQVVAGVPHALTVAATNVRDKRSIYSNYGPGIDIAAPGDDILSLRARRTDLLLNIPGVTYKAETAFVGSDRRYYRASGTSFATPIVAGIAGLLIADNPSLTAEQVMRMIKNSAEDIETPGVDHFTGYGLVDAAAALRADPNYFVKARIDGVEVAVENGRQFLRVRGQADANEFASAKLMIGVGPNPDQWINSVAAAQRVDSGTLGQIPAADFAGKTQWTIRLLVTHTDGSYREFWFLLNLG